MSTQRIELEGTAEEIRELLASFAGQRLHVTVRPEEARPRAETSTIMSVTDALLAMAEDMPPEERAKMPPDLADQHDHYIYGWHKK